MMGEVRTKMTMAEIWKMMGVTPEELAEINAEMESKKRDKDGRVCICGHAARRHEDVFGRVLCRPGRQRCPCPELVPVLEVGDTRAFLARTQGPGPRHALGRGSAAMERLAAKLGSPITAEWLVELKCQACGGENGVMPVAVTQAGFISESPEARNGLLCTGCVEQLSKKRSVV